jgi:hypothetical protein
VAGRCRAGGARGLHGSRPACSARPAPVRRSPTPPGSGWTRTRRGRRPATGGVGRRRCRPRRAGHRPSGEPRTRGTHRGHGRHGAPCQPVAARRVRGGRQRNAGPYRGTARRDQHDTRPVGCGRRRCRRWRRFRSCLPGSFPAATPAQDSAFYGATWSALRELNIPVLHSLGLRGEGIRIAIFDTGFFLAHESLMNRRVLAQRDFINGTNNAVGHPSDPPNQLRHGTAVMSLLGGYAEGRLVGGAWQASFYLAKVKRSGDDTQADEDRWVAAAEWADSLGVHIINSSIGFRSNFSDREPHPVRRTGWQHHRHDARRGRGCPPRHHRGRGHRQRRPVCRYPVGACRRRQRDQRRRGGAAAPRSCRVARRHQLARPHGRWPHQAGACCPRVPAHGGVHVQHVAYEAGFTGSSFATPFIAASAAVFRQAWPGLSAMAVRSALMLAGSDAQRPNNVVGTACLTWLRP